MKKGEYIIIKVADIEEKVKRSNKCIADLELKSGIIYHCEKTRIQVLQALLTNPKDLYDVVEDACMNGIFIASNYNAMVDEFKQDYLNNLEI